MPVCFAMSGVACAFGGANVSSANVINASAVVPTSPRTAVNVIVFLCRIVILQFARAFGRKHISADYPIIATGGTRQYRKKGTLRSLNHHRERNKIIKKIKLGRTAMRIIILAGIIALVLGAVSYFSLNARQTPTGSAYADSSVHIDPRWNWRTVATGHGEATCEPRRISGWIFVDFHRPAGEPRLCSYSQ